MPTELETAAFSGGSACSRLAKSRQLNVAAKFKKTVGTLNIKNSNAKMMLKIESLFGQRDRYGEQQWDDKLSQADAARLVVRDFSRRFSILALGCAHECLTPMPPS
jgi:hypothetical protein